MIETIETTPQDGASSFMTRLSSLLSLPWLPFILAILFISVDQVSGPYIQFPATFVIPVALSAWYGGRNQALLLAVGQPALNLFVSFLLHTNASDIPPAMVALNAAIRASVLAILAYFISRTAVQNRELARRVGLLRGEIPICFGCHKAQDESKNWIPLEIYVARHTEANFSQSICPVCKVQYSAGQAT